MNLESGLLGIALVCYSSRGHSLVFSYPNDYIQSSTTLPPHATTTNNSLHSNTITNSQIQSTSSTIINSNNTTIDTATNNSTNANLSSNATETFVNFDVQFISDILSPKSALCDRVFELTIDHITFLGSD